MQDWSRKLVCSASASGEVFSTAESEIETEGSGRSSGSLEQAVRARPSEVIIVAVRIKWRDMISIMALGLGCVPCLALTTHPLANTGAHQAIEYSEPKLGRKTI